MIFLDAAFRKETPYTPIWLMRQAGRYLCEYQHTRKQAGSFLQLCQHVELATEVTLQPVEILDVDAAILFSDILLVPMAMGLELAFSEGEGPRFLTPIRDEDGVNALHTHISKKLDYVYEIVFNVRKKLAKDKALIGFCGAPWTLATYMIEGQGSKSYAHSKALLYKQPMLLHRLLAMLRDELIAYLRAQIRAGANAVQIFDSWASALTPCAYVEFGFRYVLDMARTLKEEFPHVPIMVFPKGVGGMLEDIRHEIDMYGGCVDVFGVDWGVGMGRAKQVLGDRCVLQGNLEPALLYDRVAMEEGVEEIVCVMGARRGHIFNLGHGMLPDLPRENAIALVQMVRNKTKR